MSPRRESDEPELLSGVYQGRTLGSPIALWIRNRDARPQDYAPLANLYRPGHGDFTTEARYGLRDPRGGGRASARETAARVAAAAIAQQLLDSEHTIEVVGWVEQVADITVAVDPESVTREQVESSAVRCPDPAAAAAMEQCIRRARDEGDSVGGAVGVGFAAVVEVGVWVDADGTWLQAATKPSVSDTMTAHCFDMAAP